MSRDDIAAMTPPEQYHAGQVAFAAGEGALDAMTKGSMYLKGWCAGAEALRLATTENEALLRNRGRIREAADVMGGTTFIASVATHCTDRYSYGPCAIHLVEAVSE